jgi:hypothetical protein
MKGLTILIILYKINHMKLFIVDNDICEDNAYNDYKISVNSQNALSG